MGNSMKVHGIHPITNENKSTGIWVQWVRRERGINENENRGPQVRTQVWSWVNCWKAVINKLRYSRGSDVTFSLCLVTFCIALDAAICFAISTIIFRNEGFCFCLNASVSEKIQDTSDLYHMFLIIRAMAIKSWFL